MNPMDAALERQVRTRAGGLCEYCKIPEEYDRPACEIEHIVARQHGGETVSHNLALACFTWEWQTCCLQW
jgi:5-methylcytosine-specific restriction endonuclease McrA